MGSMPTRRTGALILLVIIVAAVAVLWIRSNDRRAPPLPEGPPPSLQPEPTDAHRIIAAGDIARCDNGWDEWTGRTVEGLAGTVLALGDLAYQHGSDSDFRDCYDPSWGRFRDRTWPVPGNHEYETAGAQGYLDYFGERVTTNGEPWYAFDVGAWRLYALDANCPIADVCDAQAELAWLRADLAAHANRCSLAYWHQPRFSSGRHGDEPRVDMLWRAVAEGGVDIVLAGHDHLYERFAPLDADGQPSDVGMRSFVVGTGGGELTGVRDIKPGSDYREPSRFGVLMFDLRDEAYDWRFVPSASTEEPVDTGSGTCR
jgi:alkaline phosphatase